MLRIYWLFFLLNIYAALTAQDTAQHIEPGRRNTAAQINKPYVILISADGFCYDYAEKFNAGNLLSLSSTGVRAESMIPVFPSKTFPNHYSIATGMYPAHHGLVHNEFYDRKKGETYKISSRKAVEDAGWYGGTPLWVLAEKQGMLSASYFFVGAEAPVQQTHPTYWYSYNTKTMIDKRINRVIDWLSLPEEIRPHFISFYFSETDDAGHRYGPNAAKTDSAVQFVDRAIGVLVEKVSALGLPVNFIFLADHGMGAIDTTSRVNIYGLFDTAGFVIRGGSSSLNLYAKNASDILPAYHSLKSAEKGFTAYLKRDIPANWHYSHSDDTYNRIGDILVAANFPKVLGNSNMHMSQGDHGFPPELKEMHAVFYAWGPQIKKGKTIASFENIHVYPLVCRLLNLKLPEHVDGDERLVKEVMK